MGTVKTGKFSALILILFPVCNNYHLKVPVDVLFHSETLRRVWNQGDNWCIIWAIDDAQITSMCDGNWLAPGKYDIKFDAYHNHFYKIIGEPGSFSRKDLPVYPDFRGNYGEWGHTCLF
jgi:hypothetical protein